MKKYELAIFDLDGTLLYTLKDLANSTNYALKENNLPERTLNEIQNFVGNGIKKLIERAVPKGTSEECTEKTYTSFMMHYTKLTKHYPVFILLITKVVCLCSFLIKKMIIGVKY
jgi:phosphoglycolate phosphatase